jgi:hypothetical protein
MRIALTPEPSQHRWTFIVGCYNSGTTLLANLLGRHPEIASLPVEGQFLTEQLVTDYELGVPRMWCQREDLFRLTEHDAGPDVGRIKRQWAMRADTSRPIILEKSPPNSARTRWLARHFEPANFIVLVRNGYAVAEGIRRKAEPKHLPDGWPLEKCAWQWRRTYEVLEKDLRGLPRVTWIRYEDLVAQPEVELARIAKFLGARDGFQFDRSRTVRVHEREEPLRDLNAESISRLSESDHRIIEQVAGDHLDKFGYRRRPQARTA